MSIFTQTINEILYEDVVAFCQEKIAEGINLDYKKDFPKELGKTISAFANSFGGVIVIGVDEDDSGKPDPPYLGINHERGLEERVWNIILNNIYPPVFPEIRVCPPSSGKTFIVIRIAQSNETPHAIRNKSKVYIRTGNRNHPEELATIEQLEWLLNRRQKSEELRQMLLRRAQERYENLCRSRSTKNEFRELTVSCSPLYPQKPLLHAHELEHIHRKITVGDEYNYRQFPPEILTTHGLQPVQDGMICSSFDEQIRYVIYLEVNRFGLIYFKQEFSQQDPLLVNDLIGTVDVTLQWMGKFYEHAMYWGLIQAVFSLDNLLGVKIRPVRLQHGRIYLGIDENQNETEKQLSWSFESSVAELNNPIARQKRVVEMIRDMTWSVGVRQSEATVIEFLKERKRWVEEKETQS